MLFECKTEKMFCFQNICCWQQDQAVLRAAGGGQLEEGGRGDHVQGEHEEPARDHAGGGLTASTCYLITTIDI